WNIRGLNHLLKQEEVRRFILLNKVAICGLLESRTLVGNVHKIAHRMCKNWDRATNHAFSPLGRLLVMWDPSILKFEVSLMTDLAIHVKAVLGNGFVVRLSFVYGLCDYRSRRYLWKDLIFNPHLASSVPWLILGDFNASRFPQDQLNGSARLSKAMSKFNECLKSMEVDDIRSVGRFFTWSNKRACNFAVNKELDRVLGNWEWHKHFNDSLAHF
ncbi:Exo_endo_phos domain-containing protein, partial [Cephalotus follicularis]